MDRRWKGSADKELREVLKFFRWQPAISLLPTWTKASRGWNLGFYEQASQVALVRNLPASAGDMRDMDSVSGSGRSPGGGHSNPLQYSCLENPMDRGTWQATVHRFAKSGTQLKWLNRHTHTLLHIALLTGTEKELRFMFNFCFSCFLICSCILLDSLRYLLLHYFQELLDNLPQILFAPPDALNLLVRGDPASLVTVVTDPHSFPWISGSSALKWKSGFRWFLLLLLFLKIST